MFKKERKKVDELVETLYDVSGWTSDFLDTLLVVLLSFCVPGSQLVAVNSLSGFCGKANSCSFQQHLKLVKEKH